MDKYLKKLEKKTLKNFSIKKKQLNKLTVTYTLRSFRILGQYLPKEKEIRINQQLLEEVGQKKYYPILRHEYAHFITHLLYPNASAHGKEWKFIMRALGDKSPTAKTSILNKSVKNAYKDSFIDVYCKCSVHKFSKYKAGRIKNKTSKYRCVLCKSKIKIKEL